MRKTLDKSRGASGRSVWNLNLGLCGQVFLEEWRVGNPALGGARARVERAAAPAEVEAVAGTITGRWYTHLRASEDGERERDDGLPAPVLASCAHDSSGSCLHESAKKAVRMRASGWAQ